MEAAWKGGFKTKSNFARAQADYVAMAASEGHITTRIGVGLYSTIWNITPEGLRHLWALKGMEE